MRNFALLYSCVAYTEGSVLNAGQRRGTRNIILIPSGECLEWRSCTPRLVLSRTLQVMLSLYAASYRRHVCS